MSGATVLGLDPGLSFGWCVLQDDEPGPIQHVAGGLWSLKGSAWEGGGLRLLRLGKLLAEVIELTTPDLVAYEDNRRAQRSSHAAVMYGQWVGAVMSACEVAGLPYVPVTPGAWKKALCGKGNATKEEVTVAVLKRWPDWGDVYGRAGDGLQYVKALLPQDHADAAGIALAALLAEAS